MSDSAAVRSRTCLLASSLTRQVGWMWKRARRREEVLLPMPKKFSRDFWEVVLIELQLGVRWDRLQLGEDAHLEQVPLGEIDA